eukprot:scaffold62137_cov41-Tisochrysis_lutea.AAC.1
MPSTAIGSTLPWGLDDIALIPHSLPLRPSPPVIPCSSVSEGFGPWPMCNTTTTLGGPCFGGRAETGLLAVFVLSITMQTMRDTQRWECRGHEN